MNNKIKYRIKVHAEKTYSGRIEKEINIQKKCWFGWSNISIPTIQHAHSCRGLGMDVGYSNIYFSSLKRAQNILKIIKERTTFKYLGHTISTFIFCIDNMSDEVYYVDLLSRKENGLFRRYSNNLDSLKESIDNLHIKETKIEYHE